MLSNEKLEDLRELLLNGDHPTKLHRADLIALINAALSHEAAPDAAVQEAIDSRRIITIISELEEFANQRLDGNYIPPDLSKGEVLDVVVPILRAALRRQIEPGWIKVSDPPKTTGTYLVVYEAKPESWSHTGPELALWDGVRWGCDWDCGDFGDYVTHWMPLPEPPKDGEE